MVRTYTGYTGCVSMIFKRHHWGPKTVYQAEKPGAPVSETQKRGEKDEGGGHWRRRKLVNKGL